MIKVKKLNRVFTIDESEKKDYLKQGFKILKADGTVEENEIKKSYTEKDVEKLTKKIEAELETVKAELEEEKNKNEELVAELETVKAELDKATANK